jgi:hypothetical protein
MRDDEGYRNYGDTCSGIYPPEDFEGLWVEHWPNGQLKFRGEYKKRNMRNGQHLCFWENGVLRELSYWERGWVTGTLIRFYEDGTKECERDYGEHGGVIRSWTEHAFSIRGRLSYINVWKNDEIVARWGRPDLLEIEEEIGVDKLIEEEIKRLYPDEEE